MKYPETSKSATFHMYQEQYILRIELFVFYDIKFSSLEDSIKISPNLFVKIGVKWFWEKRHDNEVDNVTLCIMKYINKIIMTYLLILATKWVAVKLRIKISKNS